MRKVDHWIDGKSEPAAFGKYVTTYDPRTGDAVAEVALGTAAEVARAVEGAHRSQKAWAALSPRERGRILAALARAVRDHTDEFVEYEVSETGKFADLMVAEVEGVADYFGYYAGIIRSFTSEVISMGADQHAYTRYEPFGVIGIVTPWNAPVLQAARGVAPCLAVGNAVIVKPSEFTSSTTVLLGQLATEVGLPAGILNVVTGTGPEAGAALVEHKLVRKIAFTGSVVTGKTIATAAAARLVPVTLELGGKSPNVIFADADLDAAVKAATGYLFNAGQVCSAFSRLIVERSIHDEVVERVVEIVSKVQPGSGLAPITTPAQFEKVKSYLSIATDEGAHVATGGAVADEGDLAKGRYIQPTVYTAVTPSMRIFREEIFGPVLSVTTPFDTEEEAIELANDTDFGLVAGLWTKDVGRVHRVSAQLDAGTIRVNGGRAGTEIPFGGYKLSGYGREKGVDALRDYSQVKAIVIGL